MSITLTPKSEPASPVTGQAARPRHVLLDVSRLAAAYAILWMHNITAPELVDSAALGRFAVPLFTLATIFLVFEGVARNPLRDWRQYVPARCARLYLPFLAWTGIYLAFKLVKGRLLPGEPNDYPGVEVLWLGSAGHLWFLPFILAVNLLAFGVARAIERRPGAAPITLAVMLVAGWLLVVLPSPAWLATRPLYAELVANALPVVAWGIALSIAWRLLGVRFMEHRAAAPVGVLVFAACTAWVWHFGRCRLAESLAGLGMLAIAMGPVEDPRVVRLGRAGALAYGIYLCHYLWFKVFEAMAAKAGFTSSWQRDAVLFLCCAAASTLLAWSLARWRWTRWLVA